MTLLAQLVATSQRVAASSARLSKIREQTLGLTSPQLAQTLEEHAILLKSMGQTKEGDKLGALAAAIRRNQKK